MAFSEAELVFLALIFIFTLVFLLLGRRNNTSTAKNTKKKRNKRKRATHQRHCQDPHQHSTRRGPDENDDDNTPVRLSNVAAVNSPFLEV